MIFFYIAILVIIVGLAIFFVCREYIHKSDNKNVGSVGVLKNKKEIESMVANVESIIMLADGNDVLTHRLVEAKENIRFFNPTANARVKLVDQKLSNKLDDLKIAVSKDNMQEVCFRILEEVEAFILQRKREENL